ncbi:MAG: SUMF1/EgtB/PvdO family nonheme iron enzyme [Verrucomicrobia bacterium]|nr:SUMF1/EgtB/PvdO family nonheme iron enzyme [Verrucomicrobiota bacterium]
MNADVVRCLSNDPILDDADVTLNSSGLLDLNGLHDQINTLTGNGNLALNGGYLKAGYSGDSFTYGGVASGGVGSILWKVGAGTWTLTGNNTHSGQTYIGDGTVLVNGTQPQSQVDFGSTSSTLGGTGVVGNLFVSGHLRPGAWNGPTPGLLTCSNLTFTSTGNYHVELFGASPGSGYDQIKVRGAVTLANATLHATLGFASPTFHNFIIIDNDGTDPVSGTFNGLPDLAMLYINGTLFQITYFGGDGNDVVLAPQTAMQRPLLRIAPVNGTNVVLWWPTNFTGYTLAAGVDAARAAWWAVTPAPVVVGATNYVTNTVGGAQMYYRLAGPGNLPSGMALIPAGSFTMGDTFSEGHADERPTHPVCVSAFYMDRNEVSKALWDEVYQLATNHGYNFDHAGLGKAANHPVHTISWYDMVKWCNARSQKEGLTPAYYTDAGQTAVYRTGRTNVENAWVNWNAGFRLPTEAEWEKAARGGLSGKRFPWGDLISQTNANYYGCISGCGFTYDLGPNGYNPIGSIGGTSPPTSPVGSFAANAYGLQDMAGNLWEWCWDWYDANWYGNYQATVDDTRGPASGSNRVLRGGSWYLPALNARCANRYASGSPSIAFNDFGFRCVRGL